MKQIFLILTAFSISFFAVASGQPASTLQSLQVKNLVIVKNGDNLSVDFDLDVSDVNLKSNQRVIYTPVLSSDTDTLLFDRVVLNGRNAAIKQQRDPGSRMAGEQSYRRNNGSAQSIHVSRIAPYQPWMDFSRLSVSEDLCGCGRLKEQASIPAGEFDNRPAPAPAMAFVAPKAEAVKAREEKGSAFVDYVVNRTEIRPDYRRNSMEIAKIIRTVNKVKEDPNLSITEINIHGYASPEGTYENNARLAEGRAASLRDYVKGLYTFPDNVFSSASTPEDWEGLRRMVDESSLENKEGVLAIIDNQALGPDARNDEIRRLYPDTYAFMLSEWYPALRHSDYTVSYVVRPFTVGETKEMMRRNPRQVSLNEMFLAAKTLEPGSDEFNEMMQIAVDTYPDDETANLNAACAALNARNWAKAARYLERAGNSPEAVHARGVLAMNEGRFDEAEKCFRIALDKGVAQAADNLKILDRLRRLASQNRQ